MCVFLAYLHVKVVESAAVFGCCARISRLSDNFHLFFCCRPNVNCRLLKFFAQAKQMINYATVRLCVSVRLSASFGPGMRFLHISSKRFFIFNFFTPPCQEGKCNFVIYFHCHLLPVIIYGPSNIAKFNAYSYEYAGSLRLHYEYLLWNCSSVNKYIYIRI